MDAPRFDRWTRSLTDTVSRRAVLALAGVALSLAATQFPGITAAKKKKRKKCGPCQTRKKGKCKGAKPDDTTCNGDGKCFAGECIPRPTCLGFNGDCQEPGQCCSEICIAGQFCFVSNVEQPCLVQSDCSSVPVALQCIGYHCRLP